MKIIVKVLKRFVGCITAILTVLTIVAVVAADIATSVYGQSITMFLGSDTYRVEGGSKENYYESDYVNYEQLLAAEEKLCQEIEAEGIVLLRNENKTLPLSQGSKISVFGQNSVDMVYGGVGAGSVDSSKAPSLKEALEFSGFEVNPVLWDFYNTGEGASYRKVVPGVTGLGNYEVNEVPQSVYTEEVKESYSEYCDAAVIVIGRSGGESADIGLSYLQFSDEEKDMIHQASNKFDKVVVVLNTNNPKELGFLEEENVDACIWIGAVGQTGLYAVGEVLKGDVNPSGHLTDTYAYDSFSAPAMVNFGDYRITNSDVQNGDTYIVYQEGIYVGYRYYETRYEDVVLGNETKDNYDYKEQVQYPFGYGLSYTDFHWSGYKVTENENELLVEIMITNEGKAAGKEVVQIYMQSPYTDYDKQNNIEKSSVELVGFAKTNQLKPGESEMVSILVDKELMKTYDAYGKGTYIVDKGDYYFAAGKNSHEALNHILAAKGKTVSDGMTENGNAEFAYLYTQKEFDADTYAVSKATGNEITNQFANADIKTYDETFTYLSRSDWSGTWPSLYADGSWEAPKEFVKALEISYEENPDAVMPEFETVSDEYGELTLAALIGADYDDPRWDALLSQMKKDELYNLIRKSGYLTMNIDSISAPKTVDKDGPAGISATLTGGNISCMAYPSEMVFASTWNVELIEKVGELIGEDGLNSGVTIWYAPAMNLHRTPYSGRNYEYYSEDAYLSAVMGAAECKGAQKKGMIVTIKHFALNDQEINRYGVAVMANEQAIRELYLGGFEGAVRGGANGVMTSMNRVGTRWSGGHKGLITETLRNEWGFKGLIITDQTSFPSFNYCDIREGLEAGTDMWLNVADNMWKLSDKELSGTVLVQMRESAHNILYQIANSNAMNGISKEAKVVSITPSWKYMRIGANIVALLFAYAMLTLTRLCFDRPISRKKRKEWKAARKESRR